MLRQVVPDRVSILSLYLSLVNKLSSSISLTWPLSAIFLIPIVWHPLGFTFPSLSPSPFTTVPIIRIPRHRLKRPTARSAWMGSICQSRAFEPSECEGPVLCPLLIAEHSNEDTRIERAPCRPLPRHLQSQHFLASILRCIWYRSR